MTLRRTSSNPASLGAEAQPAASEAARIREAGRATPIIGSPAAASEGGWHDVARMRIGGRRGHRHVATAGVHMAIGAVTHRVTGRGHLLGPGGLVPPPSVRAHRGGPGAASPPAAPELPPRRGTPANAPATEPVRGPSRRGQSPRPRHHDRRGPRWWAALPRASRGPFPRDPYGPLAPPIHAPSRCGLAPGRGLLQSTIRRPCRARATARCRDRGRPALPEKRARGRGHPRRPRAAHPGFGPRRTRPRYGSP